MPCEHQGRGIINSLGFKGLFAMRPWGRNRIYVSGADQKDFAPAGQGFLNSGPLSVRITSKRSRIVSVPSTNSIASKVSQTSAWVFRASKETSIKLQLRKSIVRRTGPPLEPSTVSISTMFASGWFSMYRSKSL